MGTVAVVVTLTMCGAVAQAATGKVPKIGFLGARSAASGTGLERLRQELRALGYVEGKNIVFESRYADNQLDRLPALADELVRIKVDALVAADTPEALAAKNATKTIPIVFVIGGDPVTAGLVNSLARPEGNITGFTLIATVLAGKRLELLKEIIPKLSRVAVLWDPQDRGSMQQWKESQLTAKELGLQIHSIEVSSANDLESAFKEATIVEDQTLDGRVLSQDPEGGTETEQGTTVVIVVGRFEEPAPPPTEPPPATTTTTPP